jgi:predicted alpha/beta-hydrolase family hydrolase
MISLKVSADIGAVSAEYMVPGGSIAIMTLAHGAGADMNHSFMVSLASRLAGAGIATLRFNFPFMEGGKGRPDKPAVAHETIAAALSHARATFPDVPLFAAGKSFGGRMTSQFLAGAQEMDVKGVVFYGFPLHQTGKPGVERAEHLKEVRIPKLFLQGTKDTLAEWDLVYSVCSSLRKTRLVRIDGADHGFKAGKRDVIGMLVAATREWVEGIVSG